MILFPKLLFSVVSCPKSVKYVSGKLVSSLPHYVDILQAALTITRPAAGVISVRQEPAFIKILAVENLVLMK